MTEPNPNVTSSAPAEGVNCPAPPPSSAETVNPLAASTPGADSEDARSVAGSEKSTASSRSGIPKFGASRLPMKAGGGAAGATVGKASGMASAHSASNTSIASASGMSRIGRPCAGQVKAQLPTVTPPKKLSSYDYVRRVSDDLNRYKLSDLIEMDEFEEDFFGNRMHSFTSATLPKTLKTFNNTFSKTTYDKSTYDKSSFDKASFDDAFSYKTYRTPFENSSSPDFFKDDPFKDYASSSYSYGSYSKPPKGLTRERSNSRERSRERSPSLRRTSLGSTGTASSMDALWDLHPRRLSEAGLSRYSDNSTVLTEDTNSFIIGQRVFVGGTKPGQIAYIGETQFAPGEWAGIVLDQPIGKNDGSVGGIRYFQCEAKRGVFSRLTRLTRYPLGPDVSGGGDSSYCASPSPTNGMRKSQISPTTSTRSALSISNTSLASAHVDFKLGDRVIIKSSQGSKVGTLRYMGLTAFAKGEWCGVELDEPRGKNDGSVEGERYFLCRPGYGLFAPVGKVSRSPSNRRPSNCVVHATGMRRSNSKESLLSMTSSLASASAAARRKSQTPPKSTSTPLPSRTALQDVLKEKQQHIEQLLKERDLERAEITKAACVADEANQKYVSLQKEFENYRLDCDRKLKEYVTRLTHFENETKELLGQLDEERGRNEDWQFKFEEAAITKADVEHKIIAQKSTNEEHVAKIVDLDQQLSQARAALEAEAGRLAQANDAINTLMESNEAAKVELEHANEKRSSLESEETKSIELVQTLQAQLEDANTALKQQQEMSAKQLDDLNKQLTRFNSEREVESFKQNQDIDELRAKYTNDMNAKNDELRMLTLNFEEAKTILECFQKEHEKFKYDASVAEQTLKKELDKLKMEMSGKVLELETQHEASKQQADDFKKLEEALAQTQKTLESQIRETENVNMEEEKSMIEVEKLKGLLEESNGTIVKLREELEMKLDGAKKELEASNMKINEMNEHINVVKGELAGKVEELTELQGKSQGIEEELAKTCQKLEKEKTELKQVHERLNVELKNLEEAKIKDSQLELQLGDAQRSVVQLEEKMAAALVNKGKLEAEIQQLLGASGEENSKLEILNKELHAKQEELDVNKAQFEGKIKELEHSLQEVKINFANVEEKAKMDKGELEKANATLKMTIEELNDATGKSHETLSKTLAEARGELKLLKTDLVEKDGTLDKLKQELNIEQQAKTTLENTLAENTKHTQELQVKLEEVTKQAAILTDNINKTQEQLEVASKDLHTQSTESDDLVTTLKASFEEQIKTLQETIAEKDATVQEMLANIEAIEKQSSQKDANATEKDLELETMSKAHLEGKKHAEELRLDLENSKQLLVNAQQENAKVTEKLHELTARISEKEHELQEAHKGEAVILDKNNKISLLEAKLSDVNKTVESIAAQLEASNKNEVKLQQELEVKLQECLKLKDEVMSKDQVGNNVLQELEHKNQEITKLQEELKTVATSMKHNELLTAELQEKLGKMVDADTGSRGEIKALTDKFNMFTRLFKVLQVTDEHKQQLLLSKDVKDAEVLRDLVANLPVQVIDDNKEKVLQLEQMINANNDVLQAANVKIKQQQNEMLLLQQEVLKARLEAQKKVTTVQVSDEALNNNNTAKLHSNDYKQLLEEKLEAETQVEFLHSIIADMQKKNEEQKARIEILESGYSPAAADELKLIGLIDKTIAPRLYCDICEEFDLHETEDCPTQADDDMPAPSPPDGKKKEKPAPRPYCEICEVFGHSTDDCTEDETY